MGFKTNLNKAIKAVGLPASGVGQALRKSLKIRSYKRGGKVKKTGLALVHKGETVMPNYQMMVNKRHAKMKH